MKLGTVVVVLFLFFNLYLISRDSKSVGIRFLYQMSGDKKLDDLRGQ
jgi:hypothetical protein